MHDKLIDNDHSASGRRTTVGSPRRASAETVCEKPAQIQVRRKEGRVEAILVTCACGEQITVNCEYADDQMMTDNAKEATHA